MEKPTLLKGVALGVLGTIAIAGLIYVFVRVVIPGLNTTVVDKFIPGVIDTSTPATPVIPDPNVAAWSEINTAGTLINLYARKDGVITTVESMASGGGDASPAQFKDDNTLVYLKRIEAKGTYDIVSYNLTTKVKTTLVSDANEIDPDSITFTGSNFIYRDKKINAAGDKLTITTYFVESGVTRTLYTLPNVLVGGRGGIASDTTKLRLSPNGTAFYDINTVYGGGTGTIKVYTLAGHVATLVKTISTATHPVWVANDTLVYLNQTTNEFAKYNVTTAATTNIPATLTASGLVVYNLGYNAKANAVTYSSGTDMGSYNTATYSLSMADASATPVKMKDHFFGKLLTSTLLFGAPVTKCSDDSCPLADGKTGALETDDLSGVKVDGLGQGGTIMWFVGYGDRY